MRKYPFRLPYVLSLLLVFSLLVAPAALADTEEETVEKSVGLASSGEVDIKTRNGHIRVDTWDQNEVRVIAEKRARAGSSSRARELLAETEIVVTESGGRVKVRAEMPDRGGWFNNESVSVAFEVTIPSGAALEAKSNNGAIEVRDIGNHARLESNNGAIKARGVKGSLEADTNNGAITAYDVYGTVNAETNNGAIEAEIRADSLPDDIRLITRNGAVEITLEPSLAATIDARTRNGRVRSDFEGGYQDERKKTLELDLNGGGPRIELESTNGSIRVREP